MVRGPRQGGSHAPFKLPLIVLLLLTVWGAHAQDPVSAEDFSQRGITRFEKNDLEGAIADFTKAIELNGQQLEFCFYFRGIALYRRGRLDEAIADLTKAITLKQHPRFYGDRGNLLAQKGDLDGALADLNQSARDAAEVCEVLRRSRYRAFNARRGHRRRSGFQKMF